MFSNFFDDFFESSRNIFRRPVKDMKPYQVFKTESGYILAINTLGISKENLSIQLSKVKGRGENISQLTVRGKTKIERIDFENSVDLQILLKLDRKVEDVSYESRDGLTLVYLKLEKEKELPEDVIDAKWIENSNEFDF